VKDPNYDVLVFDAASFGEAGPELVGCAKAAAPSLKTVVVASAVSCAPRWEAAYRQQGIFYYAVEPFADNEIIEILDAAYRPQGQLRTQPARQKEPSAPVSGIRITNRNGHRVHLLAGPGLLRRSDGLGERLRQKLADRMFPIMTTSGDAEITPADIFLAAGTCDRLLVLLAKDMGRLPASLVHDINGEFVSVPAESAGKVTTLVVQPRAEGPGPAEFDNGTAAALAEHIVREMASC